MLKTAILLISFALPVSAAGTSIERIPLNAVNDSTHWQKLTRPSVPPSRFVPNGEGEVLIESEGGFALVYHPLEKDKAFSRLRWRWKVDRSGIATDASMKGSDRPVALHVWFAPPDSASGFWHSLRSGIASMLGAPPPGQVISYMWSGLNADGENFVNPHLPERGNIVILRGRNSPTGTWLSEEIDIRADFRRLFGTDAPPPAFVAISADTDDTCATTRAAIADIKFVSNQMAR